MANEQSTLCRPIFPINNSLYVCQRFLGTVHFMWANVRIQGDSVVGHFSVVDTFRCSHPQFTLLLVQSIYPNSSHNLWLRPTCPYFPVFSDAVCVYAYSSHIHYLHSYQCYFELTGVKQNYMSALLRNSRGICPCPPVPVSMSICTQQAICKIIVTAIRERVHVHSFCHYGTQ